MWRKQQREPGGGRRSSPAEYCHHRSLTCASTCLQNIFVWCGGKSNILERNKARDLALAIRDSERQGKAQVEIVTDGEEPAEMVQVEGTLGWVASGWKLLRGCDQLRDMRAFSHRLGGEASGPLLIGCLVIQSQVPLWADGPVAWQVGRLNQPSLPLLGTLAQDSWPRQSQWPSVMGWEGLGQLHRNPRKPSLP